MTVEALNPLAKGIFSSTLFVVPAVPLIDENQTLKQRRISITQDVAASK